MSQNLILSLFLCYVWDLFCKEFLGVYKLCVFLLHKYMCSKELVFKMFRSFNFLPFHIKHKWVLHGFCESLPTWISLETFCCLRFFLIDLYLWIMNISVCIRSYLFVVWGRYVKFSRVLFLTVLFFLTKAIKVLMRL